MPQYSTGYIIPNIINTGLDVIPCTYTSIPPSYIDTTTSPPGSWGSTPSSELNPEGTMLFIPFDALISDRFVNFKFNFGLENVENLISVDKINIKFSVLRDAETLPPIAAPIEHDLQFRGLPIYSTDFFGSIISFSPSYFIPEGDPVIDSSEDTPNVNTFTLDGPVAFTGDPFIDFTLFGVHQYTKSYDRVYKSATDILFNNLITDEQKSSPLSEIYFVDPINNPFFDPSQFNDIEFIIKRIAASGENFIIPYRPEIEIIYTAGSIPPPPFNPNTPRRIHISGNSKLSVTPTQGNIITNDKLADELGTGNSQVVGQNNLLEGNSGYASNTPFPFPNIYSSFSLNYNIGTAYSININEVTSINSITIKYSSKSANESGGFSYQFLYHLQKDSFVYFNMGDIHTNTDYANFERTITVNESNSAFFTPERIFSDNLNLKIRRQIGTISDSFGNSVTFTGNSEPNAYLDTISIQNINDNGPRISVNYSTPTSQNNTRILVPSVI